MPVETMRTQWLFYIIPTLILNLPLLSRAETHSQSPSTTTERKITENKFSVDALAFLASHFGLGENWIKNRYEPNMPNAIEKAKTQGDETDLATQLAFLMGRINSNQRGKLIEDSRNEIATEKAKEGEQRDDRKILLLERLLWGGLVAEEKPSNRTEARSFNEKFQEEYRSVKEKNQEIREKMRQAAEGIPTAVQWLKENLDQSALTAWIESQKNSGNGALASELLFGYATKLPDGERFVDLHASDGQGERLYLGKTRDTAERVMDKHFDAIATLGRGRGFGGSTIASRDHVYEPTRRWFVNDAGEYTRGTPSNVRPNLPTPSSSPTASPTPTDTTPPSPEDTGILTNALAMLSGTGGRCNACHVTTTNSGTNLANLKIWVTIEGTRRGPLTLTETLNKLTSAPLNTEGMFRGVQEANFRRWANRQRELNGGK